MVAEARAHELGNDAQRLHAHQQRPGVAAVRRHHAVHLAHLAPQAHRARFLPELCAPSDTGPDLARVEVQEAADVLLAVLLVGARFHAADADLVK